MCVRFHEQAEKSEENLVAFSHSQFGSLYQSGHRFFDSPASESPVAGVFPPKSWLGIR